MTSQCGRSVEQVLVVRVDIGVMTYEAINVAPQCGVPPQVLVVRVDIGVMIYEGMTSQCGSGTGPGCPSGYRTGDL